MREKLHLLVLISSLVNTPDVNQNRVSYIALLKKTFSETLIPNYDCIKGPFLEKSLQKAASKAEALIHHGIKKASQDYILPKDVWSAETLSHRQVRRYSSDKLREFCWRSTTGGRTHHSRSGFFPEKP
jgi:hypothetical protein